MIDPIAEYVLVAAGLLLFILLFVFKHKIISVIGCFIWAIMAWSFFADFYASVERMNTVWGLAWVSLIMAIVFITSIFWINPKEKVIEEKDTREDWEIDDERRSKRMAYLTRYRPRSRFHGTKK